MHTESICQARANSFYAHLPERVQSELTEREWKTLALFIEHKLPEWSKNRVSHFTNAADGLPRTVEFSPKAERAIIHLNKFPNSCIRREVHYDTQRPLVQFRYKRHSLVPEKA